MKLFAGTESSWSLRALLCMEIAGIPPEPGIFDLSNEESRRELKRLSPTGRVPVLRDGDVVVYDSLSITEYLNESKPGLLYSAEAALRAEERSLCAELHSGFAEVRRQMPFVASGETAPVALSAEAEAEIERIGIIFAATRGGFYRGETPGAVDAFYSVMAYRLASYGVHFTGRAGHYQNALTEWPLFRRSLSRLCPKRCPGDVVIVVDNYDRAPPETGGVCSSD
ncbi:glutathione S-transferase family protein [Tatumella sp. UCD-D_suzukii]|uniref:glutathione S-transferase family protein n=1 Tax=Tatumella sp. UCD-D_suzukii TaxID=1408192 RepID=UPI00046FB370|nr:glutathione S-transferase N-terminal domain-containing protein [Tatumella sp. UCD-D_suzukii]